MPASLWLWSWVHGPGEFRCKLPWLDPYSIMDSGIDVASAKFFKPGNCFMCKTFMCVMSVLPNVLLCHGSSRFLTLHSEMRRKAVQRPESRFGLRAWHVLEQPCKPSSVSSPSCKDSHGSSVVQCHLIKFPQNFMLKKRSMINSFVLWLDKQSTAAYTVLLLHQLSRSCVFWTVFLSQDIFPTLSLLFFFAFNYSSISVSFSASSLK